MHYVMSDIHGCYQEYMELIGLLNLGEEDMLYVLGDAMDRGPEPVRVMLDLMERPQVEYLIGNHDLMFLETMYRLEQEITEESIQRSLNYQTMGMYTAWMRNGGNTTLAKVKELEKAQRHDIMEYLEECILYEVLDINGKQYILAHAGIRGFEEGKPLDEYGVDDFLWKRPDYGKQFFQDENRILVTGHTPTPLIRDDRQPVIYQESGHLAIDCGCVFGGALAAVCLETGVAYYVRSYKGSRV